MFKKFKIPIVLGALLITVLFAQTASAARQQILRTSCEERLQYINEALPLFPDVSTLSEEEQDRIKEAQEAAKNDCNEETGNAAPQAQSDYYNEHYEDFPGPHKDQIDLDNEPMTVFKDYHSPFTDHTHKYFNDSLEEEVLEGDRVASMKFFLSLMKKWEFQLQGDFVSNAMLDNVECSGYKTKIETPADLLTVESIEHCDGDGFIPSLMSDGSINNIPINVTYDQNAHKITYEFTDLDNLPHIFGNNRTLIPATSDPENRDFSLIINFPTRSDIDKKAWGSTITSKVLIRDHMKVIQDADASTDNFEPGEHNGWNKLPANSNFGNAGNDYYWFPIGTTTTIWQAAPGERLEQCTLLNAELGSKDQVDVQVRGEHEEIEAHKINVTALNHTFDEIPEDAAIEYIALDDPNGRFFSGNEFDVIENGNSVKRHLLLSDRQNAEGQVSHRTNDNIRAIYYEGSGRVSVALVGIPEEQNSPDCQDIVEVPEPGICLAVGLTKPPMKLALSDDTLARDFDPADGPMYFLNMSTFEGEGDIPEDLKLKWDAKNVGFGEGKFWLPPWQLDPPDPNEDRKLMVPTGDDPTLTEFGGGFGSRGIFFQPTPGRSKVRLELASEDEEYINSGVCFDEIEFGSVCTDLGVTIGDLEFVNGVAVNPINFDANFAPNDNAPFGTLIEIRSDAEDEQCFADNGVTKTRMLKLDDGRIIWVFNEDFTYYCTRKGNLSFRLNHLTQPELVNECFAQEVSQCIDLTLEEPPLELTEGQARVLADDYDPEEGSLFLVKVSTYGFEDRDPTEASLKWSSLDARGEQGRFWLPAWQVDRENPDRRLLLPTDEDPTINPAIGSNFAKSIFYQPGGDASQVKVEWDGISESFANRGVCFDIIDFPEEPPEEEDPICEALQVNFQDEIREQQLSSFIAGSLNNEGDLFDGKITYTVDAGFGRFFTARPANLPANDSSFNAPAEFNENQNIEAPEDGFCGDLNLDQGVQTVTVDPGTRVWFFAEIPAGGDPTDVITISTTCTEIAGCERTFSITPVIVEEPICLDLNFVSEPASPLTVDQDATFTIAPVDTNGDPLPADTELVISNTTGGNIINGGGAVGDNPTVSDFPVQFQDSNQAGTVGISVDPDSEFFSTTCQDGIQVLDRPPELICTDLIGTTITEVGGEALAENTPLAENSVYIITAADAEYSDDDAVDPQEITYTINENYGTIINLEMANGEVAVNFERQFATIIQGLNNIGEEQSLERLKNRFGENSFTQTVTRAEGIPVYIVTFADQDDDFPASATDILTISAANFFNPECIDRYDIEVEEEQLQCVDLSFAPLRGAFDPSDDITVFNITDDFSDHKGEIRVSIGDSKGLITKLDEEIFSNTVTFSQDEVANSNNLLSFVYQKDDNYDPKTDTITITVEAIGDPNLPADTCEDSLTINPNPTGEDLLCIDVDIIQPDTPWKLDGGDCEQQTVQIQATTDPVDLRDQLTYVWEIKGDGNWLGDGKRIEEDGQFVQVIENCSDGTEITVFTKSKVPNVTIADDCEDRVEAIDETVPREDIPPKLDKVVFPEGDIDFVDDIINIGEGVQYVTYMLILNTGDMGIDMVNLSDEDLRNGFLGGQFAGSNFEFKGMSVGVFEKNFNDARVLLRTPDYTPDAGSSAFNDLKANLRENFDTNENHGDLNDYENDYECNDDNDICIEGDFNANVLKFINGDDIQLRNVADLGPEAGIVIKYQMINNSIIDDESCTRISEYEGCGEEFDNEAVLEFFYTDEDGNKTAEKINDRARVIVICPFIITRQGGDVFFQSAIETGIDVAQCSPVKGGDAPVITPITKKDVTIVKTGGEDAENKFLALPTHDVCAFSNFDENITGYDNALENFSSTICEIKADVAEQWTQSNIVEAINANITRLARFGANLNSEDLRTARDNAENKAQGVFIKNGGELRIEGGTLTVEAGNGLPAAQTYIVRGGDLVINSNIEYGVTDYSRPSSIASAAFIVIDGNIIIGPDVTRIDGILMAVDTNPEDDHIPEGDLGKVIQTLDQSTVPPSNIKKALRINGNLIGNVVSLFERRRATVDPRRDEGSVSIHYDARILLNTPPGISDLINLQQAIVP
jgi:hypothetical protein